MYTTNITALKPEAFITVKKNRLKLYEDKNHYLKNKSNFEIELFNPTSEKVLAKIWINDKLMSASGIVVMPGQRVYLERFLDTPKKFQFDTYEVDDVKETERAREKNGLVKIAFFSEQKASNPYFYSNGSSTLLLGNSSNGTITTTGMYSGNVNVSYTSNSSPIGVVASYNASSNTFAGPNIRSVETGRVAEGKKSDQEFATTSGNFADWAFHTYEYHLLPESIRQVLAGEIRNYCSECGFRIRKSSWKFCPNCGASH
jgi:hypothetical protein